MTQKKLHKTVTSFTKGILGRRSSRLMCYAVCCPLQGFLSLLEVRAELINGSLSTLTFPHNHVWLELENGIIIDPTADQFNEYGYDMPQIYIGIKPDYYKYEPIILHFRIIVVN